MITLPLTEQQVKELVSPETRALMERCERMVATGPKRESVSDPPSKSPATVRPRAG